MLEYMLVRNLDAPILEKSQSRLEWVVLDEAHSYIGSQAAEIALLIRRVLHAFGVNPNQVRFVATSATIGAPRGEAGQQLKRFLAQVAGVDASRVHLIAGERHVPDLPVAPAQAPVSLDELWRIDQDKSEHQPRRYRALAAHPMALKLRRSFIDQDGKPRVQRLSDVCRIIVPESKEPTHETQRNALRWLDLLHGTRDAAGTAFLPLRAHLFHQTLSGLWACSDPDCSDRPESLKQTEWRFGQIYLEPRKHCTCHAPVYELAACDDCGTPVLSAETDGHRLIAPKPPAVTDEFELDLERDEGTEDDEDEEPTSGKVRPALITNRPGAEHTAKCAVVKTTRRIREEGDPNETVNLWIQEADANGLICPHCGARQRNRREQFQPARIGAPFMLTTILPTLLEFAPDGEKPATHPHRGRRLLTFNDSRQGTARMAAKLQQESERNRVRGLVYHIALRDGLGTSATEAQALKQKIARYETQIKKIKDNRGFLEGEIADMHAELRRLDQPTPIPFNDMANELAKQSGFERMYQHYRDNVSQECFGPGGPLELARLFLVREFGRRPKVQNNLETMGLVALRYPAIDRFDQYIADFSITETRHLLKIALDFFVRAGGSLQISDEWRQWLGMPFPQTIIVERDREDTDRYQRRWPRAKRSGKRNHLVRLLAYVLEVDIENPYGQDKIDEVLIQLWKTLTQETKLLKVSAEGQFHLAPEQLAFAPVSKAWLCPITQRFLDTTLRGVTPYLLPDGRGYPKCEAVDLPPYPEPFGGEAGDLRRTQDARRWLRENEVIGDLRRRGYWTVVNDRAIELPPYFVAAEHSAQLSSQRLKQHEDAFKKGDVNLLSCSTTMEMGIDIGGINLVAMNNVPPHPANYLQRAGRAGRRRESNSTALTLCKSNPHDQMVFAKSTWPFTTPLPAPVVSLDSALLVQRHVNALVLSHFLKNALAGTTHDRSKLGCEWFFTRSSQESSLAQRFQAWCENDAHENNAHNESTLIEGLEHLVHGSVLHGRGERDLLQTTGETIQHVATGWLSEWNQLCAQRETAVNAAGEKDPAARAIGYQKKRMSEEYLLRELAGRGVLLGYGFPTHIAAFDNLTVAQFKRDQQAREEQKSRDDNRFQRRELANRDSATALREYAPGAQVVIDGLVYRCAGVTLNWKIPASEQEAREAQAIRHAWRCQNCGASGWQRQWRSPFECPDCAAPIKGGDTHREFIEPAGFAVDFYQSPGNDVSTQDFIPVEPAWVSIPADQAAWHDLVNPALGRFRLSANGSIIHQSRGLNGRGYALCLHCGRAEAMPRDGGDRPDLCKPGKEHFPLRGARKKTSGKSEYCSGSSDPLAIKTGLTLGDARYTDVLEIQLKDPDGLWLNDRIVARTLAVALRDTLAEALGVQAQELGCTIKPVRPEPDENILCQSILIYDHFAAGFSSSADRFIGDLFRKVRDRLICPAECDSACPHCVLDFDQRFDAENLDRKQALNFLSEDWLNTHRLPDQYAFFGTSSTAEFMTIEDALVRTVRCNPNATVRLYAAGSAQDCDIGVSPWRLLAYRLVSLGAKVALYLHQETLNHLDPDEKHLLVGLIYAPRVELFEIPDTLRAGNGWIIAECLEGTGPTRWAVPDPEALIPDQGWGSTRPLLVAKDQPETQFSSTPINVASLRLPTAGPSDREIEIHHELDGSLPGFGQRFWAHLLDEHSGLQTLLDDPAHPIERIAYQDRYLFSPLSIAVFVRVLAGLMERVGTSGWPQPNVQIITLNQRQARARKRSNSIWQDWPDVSARDQVLELLCMEHDMELQLEAVQKHQAAHGRVLVIRMSSDIEVTIRFDQGFSYWRVSDSENTSRSRFDFGAEIDEQVSAIDSQELAVSGSDHPTQIFVSIH